MRTPKQIEASRQNGRKSRGPITATGKKNSAANSRKHGLFASGFVWTPNDPALFEERLAYFRAAMRPANAVERALVDRIAYLSASIICAARECHKHLAAIVAKRPKASSTAFDIMSGIEFRLRTERFRAFDEWLRLHPPVNRTQTQNFAERTRQGTQTKDSAGNEGPNAGPIRAASAASANPEKIAERTRGIAASTTPADPESTPTGIPCIPDDNPRPNWYHSDAKGTS